MPLRMASSGAAKEMRTWDLSGEDAARYDEELLL